MSRRDIFLIVQAVLCVSLAILLAAAAIGIYREGAVRKAEQPLEQIYTPQIVAERLAPIMPLFFASIGLTVAGLLLGVKGRATRVKTKDVEKAGASLRAGSGRRGHGVLQAALVAVAIALIVVGAFNGSARDVLYKAAKICTECIGLG